MRKKDEERGIARERIGILLSMAKKHAREEMQLSRRYVELSKRIGMRYNVPLGKEAKRAFCRNCLSYMIPGANCKIRTSRNKQAVSVICLACGHISYFPYIREKKKRKEANKEP